MKDERGPGEFTVLVVVGDEAERDAAAGVLRGAGYQTLEAASGGEGLRLAREAGADVIVLQVELPDVDGFEVCRRLKADARTALIPVLHKTATHRDSSAYVRGLEAGADAYLMEPVEGPVLLATVAALLRTARAKAALRQARDELEGRVAQRTAALEAEVRERRQAQEQAQRQAVHAQALARAAAQLDQQLDLSAVLQAIYTSIAETLDVPVVTISLYNSEQEQFEPALAQGLPPGIVESMQPVPLRMTTQPEGDSSAAVITRDVQELVDFPNAALYRELDIRTTVNINLLRKGQLVGRLNIGTIGEPRDFSEAEMTLLRGLTSQAALALNNARLYEEVKSGREQLAELNWRLTQAEEEERRRLSRELHDSAGQLATALQMNLTLIRAGMPEGETRRQLAEVEGIAEQLYEEIRQVSHSLRPPHLEVLGLNGALEALCRQFSETAGLPVRYDGQAFAALGDVVSITLYRIAQEALTNVARHAGDCEARVTLGGQDGYIELTVEDDGAGFDAAGVMGSGEGLGLQGMRERVQLLKGRLEIASRAGEGTRLVARCAVDPGSRA